MGLREGIGGEGVGRVDAEGCGGGEGGEGEMVGVVEVDMVDGEGAAGASLPVEEERNLLGEDLDADGAVAEEYVCDEPSFADEGLLLLVGREAV